MEVINNNVHSVYYDIATHFDESRYAFWKAVREFLDTLPPYSLVADVGCGNGKYSRYRSDLVFFCNDVCVPLLRKITNPHHHVEMHSFTGVLQADGASLPYRNNSMDAAISIAVVHHVPTYEGRLNFLRNILQSLRPGGRFVFTVWALEQPHKFNWVNITDANGNNDFLIPWKDKYSNKTYQRFYHLFSESEIQDVLSDLESHNDTTHTKLTSSYKFEMNNWVVEISLT